MLPHIFIPSLLKCVFRYIIIGETFYTIISQVFPCASFIGLNAPRLNLRILLSTQTQTPPATILGDRPASFVKSEKLRRPMSPHLTIYAAQLTALMSFANRATGAGLAAGMNNKNNLFIY